MTRDRVATWMVPTGMTSHVHAFDAREDGSFRISLTYDAPTGKGKMAAQILFIALAWWAGIYYRA